jgi:hypothetical protein
MHLKIKDRDPTQCFLLTVGDLLLLRSLFFRFRLRNWLFLKLFDQLFFTLLDINICIVKLCKNIFKILILNHLVFILKLKFIGYFI